MRTLDSTGRCAGASHHQPDDLRLRPGERKTDLARRAGQPLDVVLDEDHLAVVGAHEIKHTIPPQESEIIDRESGFGGGHKFSIHIINVRHGSFSPRVGFNRVLKNRA